MFWLRNKKNNFQLHTLIWRSNVPFIVCASNESSGECAGKPEPLLVSHVPNVKCQFNFLIIILRFEFIFFCHVLRNQRESVLFTVICCMVHGVVVILSTTPVITTGVFVKA